MLKARESRFPPCQKFPVLLAEKDQIPAGDYSQLAAPVATQPSRGRSIMDALTSNMPLEQSQTLTLVAVGFVVCSLYVLKKVRDQKKVEAATSTTPKETQNQRLHIATNSGGDDTNSSPPRVQRHDSIADVVELVVYPIKSCAGISLDRVALTSTGFRGDRMWMVVEPRTTTTPTTTTTTTTTSHANKQYQFLTQRQCPRLSLIQPKIQSTNSFELGETPRQKVGLVHGMKSVTLSAPGQRDLVCPVIRAFHTTAIMCDVTLWDPGTTDDANAVVDQGDEVAEWLSTYLDRPNLRLVFRDSTCAREVNRKYRAPGNQPSQVSFADGMQYLIASRTSLAVLNQKIQTNKTTTRKKNGTNDDGEALTMDRFRPNIIVNRSAPFDEDTWSEIQIGNNHEAKVTFHGVKHCTRCVIPTTDQKTGIQTGPFSEPLTTLRTFRRLDGDKGKPLFGENLAHREDEWDVNGIAPFVSVGDEVYLVQRKDRGVIVGSKSKGGGGGGGGCILQ